MMCDFCNKPDPEWEFPCRDFSFTSLSGIEHVSKGAWLACDTCANLLESRQYDELANRSAYSALQNPTKQDIDLLFDLHLSFRLSRTGPAVRRER